MAKMADRQATEAYLAAFIDELYLQGVRQVVLSPGSRSTPLAIAFKASSFEVTVDIDERGAAFIALGIAKATHRPVCLVCTSGTAVANYFPAICEARESRIPLIVLSADRPHELRDLGAPQTMDQIKLFSDKVAFFKEMPVASGSPSDVAFWRQTAREAFIRCGGSDLEPCGDGAVGCPVHLNFPFPEPLAIDMPDQAAFCRGRSEAGPSSLQGTIGSTGCLNHGIVRELEELMDGHRGVIVCGEGTYPRSLIGLAHHLGMPVLPDPLACLEPQEEGKSPTCLRCLDDLAVIPSFDKLFRDGLQPAFDLVLRFGRYPISKALYRHIEACRPVQIVVDPLSTRDFDLDTATFVRATPSAFVRSFDLDAPVADAAAKQVYLDGWTALDRDASRLLGSVVESKDGFMGSYVRAVITHLDERTLLFSANSLSVRAVDTFCVRPLPLLTVMCNRGLSGIDGTLSTALGASTAYERSVLLCGDLAFLHDIDALAAAARHPRNLVVVLFDNDGGSIFNMLPQRSDEAWFRDLFLTPQQVDYAKVCEGFGIPFVHADDIAGFVALFEDAKKRAGVSVIEVSVPIDQTSAWMRWW